MPRSVTLLGVFIVAAACSSGTSPGQTATPAAAPTPMASASIASAAPTPTPATQPTAAATAPPKVPTAAATAEPVHPTEVTGTVSCPSISYTSRATSGAVAYRDGRGGCTVKADDKRVTGSASVTGWSADQWPTSTAAKTQSTPSEAGAFVQWGTRRIAAGGGAWVGTGRGVFVADRGNMIVTWYKGSGAYAGLGYFELLTGPSRSMSVRGLIFPGDPPAWPAIPAADAAAPSPPDGTTDPNAGRPALPKTVAYGPVTSVTARFAYTTTELGMTASGPDGATRYDSGTWAGITVANDPRATATYSTPTWTIDIWGTFDDGLGIQWGTDVRSATSGSGWACSDTGIYASTGDTIVAWCEGRGALAGQGYFELIVSNDPFGIEGDPSTGGVDHGVVFPGAPPLE